MIAATAPFPNLPMNFLETNLMRALYRRIQSLITDLGIIDLALITVLILVMVEFARAGW